MAHDAHGTVDFCGIKPGVKLKLEAMQPCTFVGLGSRQALHGRLLNRMEEGYYFVILYLDFFYQKVSELDNKISNLVRFVVPFCVTL